MAFLSQDLPPVGVHMYPFGLFLGDIKSLILQKGYQPSKYAPNDTEHHENPLTHLTPPAPPQRPYRTFIKKFSVSVSARSAVWNHLLLQTEHSMIRPLPRTCGMNPDTEDTQRGEVRGWKGGGEQQR